MNNLLKTSVFDKMIRKAKSDSRWNVDNLDKVLINCNYGEEVDDFRLFFLLVRAISLH